MRVLLLALGLALVIATAVWWFWLRPRVPDAETVSAAYATPLPPPAEALRVFHLGHSLVGPDIPFMLQQLAQAAGFEDHAYASQVGWGTPLRTHWDPEIEIMGLETVRDQGDWADAREAVGSGAYDAVVLTEMVEIKDAIRYHDSTTYFGRWADLAREAGPEVRVYLYETWHWVDDPAGWTNRLEGDRAPYWENAILLPDLARHPERPAHMIPAGTVMARLMAEIEARGGVDGIPGPEALFGVDDQGRPDKIHLGDLGKYLVALTHFAVLYQRSPVGLPYRLTRADGSPADPPTPEAARLMQEVVWETVTSDPMTGVAQ
ncbi:hypothetical protein ACFORG_11145 [Lutimaribacter marinistellae]|uniref:Uncharacterized protein n=1 Tax=Lutimaribacter marinistellae TaxID=1820329 RepID=A0ABV7TJK3_9RHOB